MWLIHFVENIVERKACSCCVPILFVIRGYLTYLSTYLCTISNQMKLHLFFFKLTRLKKNGDMLDKNLLVPWNEHGFEHTLHQVPALDLGSCSTHSYHQPDTPSVGPPDRLTLRSVSRRETCSKWCENCRGIKSQSAKSHYPCDRAECPFG